MRYINLIAPLWSLRSSKSKNKCLFFNFTLNLVRYGNQKYTECHISFVLRFRNKLEWFLTLYLLKAKITCLDIHRPLLAHIKNSIVQNTHLEEKKEWNSGSRKHRSFEQYYYCSRLWVFSWTGHNAYTRDQTGTIIENWASWFHISKKIQTGFSRRYGDSGNTTTREPHLSYPLISIGKIAGTKLAYAHFRKVKISPYKTLNLYVETIEQFYFYFWRLVNGLICYWIFSLLLF